MEVARFEVFYTKLDPTQGTEIKKTRPCVILSPPEMCQLNNVIVAPLNSKGFLAPSRIPLTFQGKSGLIVLDQIRAIDKSRLGKKLGKLHSSTAEKVCQTLQVLFAY